MHQESNLQQNLIETAERQRDGRVLVHVRLGFAALEDGCHGQV